GRMIRPDREGFDKVLVDAPCSSESRFELGDPDTFAYWSLRKIKEMRKKQIGLIRSGIRCLKSGGTLVYSTCTFAPEENEGVIHFILKKMGGEVSLEEIATAPESRYPVLTEWEKKEFEGLEGKPSRYIFKQDGSAFFVAKFRKN
ncbi:MAG: RsmB/NOP family class I SAM-dependent RNA methyltransferase, partial [Candidatus Omnitrophica bacterium]|nr:RsmB/NOP family class I SAM-dependent RNA methyltransferase [Candidatus Omnitrophota bacterium]